MNSFSNINILISFILLILINADAVQEPNKKNFQHRPENITKIEIKRKSFLGFINFPTPYNSGELSKYFKPSKIEDKTKKGQVQEKFDFIQLGQGIIYTIVNNGWKSTLFNYHLLMENRSKEYLLRLWVDILPNVILIIIFSLIAEKHRNRFQIAALILLFSLANYYNSYDKTILAFLDLFLRMCGSTCISMFLSQFKLHYIVKGFCSGTLGYFNTKSVELFVFTYIAEIMKSFKQKM